MQGDQYWTVQNKHRKKKKKPSKNNIHFKSTTKNPFMHNIIHLYYMRFVQHHTKKKKSSLHHVHDDAADHDTLTKQVRDRILRPPRSLRSLFRAKTRHRL